MREWSGPLYEVRAHAPDMGWRMRCEVHLAVAFEGDVVVDDPDGIVVEAAFVPPTECAALLASCAPWVGEPLAAWLRDRWEPGSGVDFRYDVFGTTRDDMRVVREAVTARRDATILHVDLDAFFAAVEQLDDPGLRGRPVIVGGLGNRGVVSTASYEARAFGVRSAMPMARARRRVRRRRSSRRAWRATSTRATRSWRCLASISPLVEQLSIDEAFVDVAGARRMLGDPPEIAATIRRRVLDEAGLCLSVGAASTKFLAKLASDLAKPDGVLVVEPGTEQAVLAPLPVSRLWGVGPATMTKLERMGLRTIGDVAAIDEQALVGALGSALGRHLHALARNDDPRGGSRTRHQVDRGRGDVRSRPAHDSRVRARARAPRRSRARLRSAGLTARTVNVKIRFGDFETHAGAHTGGRDRCEHRRARRGARSWLRSTSAAACASWGWRCRDSTRSRACRRPST